MLKKTIATEAVQVQKDDLPFKKCSICGKMRAIDDLYLIGDKQICKFCKDDISDK